MFKKTLIASILTLTATTGLAQIPEGSYKLDGAHSKVGFSIAHLVISTVEGRFNSYEGTIVIDKNIAKSSVEAKINVASIDTGIKDRDDHLKSPDFFDAAKNPSITFKSKKVSLKDKELTVNGDLSIKGITKAVTLKGKYLGAVKDGYGQEKVAFDLSTKINRKDFGLTWSNVVEVGPVVGDEVEISLKVQGTKEVKK